MQAYVVQYRHSLQKKRSVTFEDVEKVTQKDIDMLFLGAMKPLFSPNRSASQDTRLRSVYDKTTFVLGSGRHPSRISWLKLGLCGGK